MKKIALLSVLACIFAFVFSCGSAGLNTDQKAEIIKQSSSSAQTIAFTGNPGAPSSKDRDASTSYTVNGNNGGSVTVNYSFDDVAMIYTFNCTFADLVVQTEDYGLVTISGSGTISFSTATDGTTTTVTMETSGETTYTSDTFTFTSSYDLSCIISTTATTYSYQITGTVDGDSVNISESGPLF